MAYSTTGLFIVTTGAWFLKGRLDCDSRRVFYTTLEATQTRRTDLWVFTLLLSESRLFCVFLFLNDGHLTAGSPLDRCVQQLAIGFEYSYIACVLIMVYGDYLCISLYFWLMELRIDLLLVFLWTSLMFYQYILMFVWCWEYMFYRYMIPNWMVRLDKFLETIHLYSMVTIDIA